ncbi:MAG: D-glycero-beta-D-manno-heptose 1-phosphate adenylyltransferase [Bacteroidales bacterium]
MDKFEFLNHRIVTKEQLLPILHVLKFKGKKIVFSNGCFDILHRGHIEYLAKAASLGDCLIIGLNTDASVKRLKGNNRPVQDEVSRALVMASLRFVDYVVLFDEDTPYELIRFIQPDILVKGSDYKEDEIVGADIVKKNGGHVTTISLVEGYSTTNIIKKSST